NASTRRRKSRILFSELKIDEGHAFDGAVVHQKPRGGGIGGPPYRRRLREEDLAEATAPSDGLSRYEHRGDKDTQDEGLLPADPVACELDPSGQGHIRQDKYRVAERVRSEEHPCESD